jgi:hypothetical protein
MRFPVSTTYADTNETVPINDHRMVFHLADKLNEMSGNGSQYKVNFIKWIQSSPNTPISTSKRLPDGTVPGAAVAAANPALRDNITATYSNATAVAAAGQAYDDWRHLDRATLKEIATNVFRTHKEAVDNGILDFSESGYLRYRLMIDLNITDEVASIGSNYDSWACDNVYFGATDWRTIDQGLSRLPAAFGPLVLNKTIFGISIQELYWNEATKKVPAKWRPNNPFDINPVSEAFDFVITAVPFSRVRLRRLPPYSSLLSRAINTMNHPAKWLCITRHASGNTYLTPSLAAAEAPTSLE